jgi:hypothetical protein
MTLKYRESTSHPSRKYSLARKVEHIKNKKNAKREKIIGPMEYRKHLLELRMLERELDTNSRITRKSSKADIKKSRELIKSQGLDRVSRELIPQEPTILDKEKYLKPIIKMGELEIPEMEIDLSNNKIPVISFPTHNPNVNSHNKKSHKSIPESFIIAIPSYNRPDLIQVKTLALLHRHGIPATKINIFVANQEQYDIYKSKVPKNLYGNLVIGELGLRNQRNFIMDYYSENTHIVQMDDDLDKIMELIIEPHSSIKDSSKQTSSKTIRKSSKSTRKLKPIEDLNGFITKAFEICKDKGIFLWGVYPLANARFMSPKMTTDLRFIVGPFWGIINRHRPDLHITIDEKENAERTLQHYTIDGAVLRFNNVGIETRYYKNKGGMQDEGKDRKQEALKSVNYLHRKYPKLTKIYLGKKSGVPEIRMLTHSH